MTTDDFMTVADEADQLRQENASLRALLQRWIDAPVPYIRIGDIMYQAEDVSGAFALIHDTELALRLSHEQH